MDIEHPEFLNFLKCAQKNKLRYMCIGGYAVNFYGYHRATEDLDIWIAPTNENKAIFFNTLICMGYTDSELIDLKKEDFTTHFVCSLGARPNVIDILTIIHKSINFDESEKTMYQYKMNEEIFVNLVSYEVLKLSKLLSRREKDIWDITKLNQIINKIK